MSRVASRAPAAKWRIPDARSRSTPANQHRKAPSAKALGYWKHPLARGYNTITGTAATQQPERERVEVAARNPAQPNYQSNDDADFDG